MKASLRATSVMASVPTTLPTKMYTKGSGCRMGWRAKEHCRMPMEMSMKECGSETCDMERLSSFWLMVCVLMVSMCMTNRMALASSHGVTAPSSMENGGMAKSVARASGPSQKVRLAKSPLKEMGKWSLQCTLMVPNMRENFPMACATEMEVSHPSLDT